MTDGTLAAIKERAADLWQRQYDDQTPMDVFGHLAAPARMKEWLRANGFPTGHDLDLSRACSERARGLKRGREMVNSAPKPETLGGLFEPGSEG